MNTLEVPVHAGNRSPFAEDVLKGLSRPEKELPSRWLYDAQGSQLYERITKQPGYYLTGCEIDCLHGCVGSIVSMLPDPCDLVELGPGDGRKAGIVIRAMRSSGRTFSYAAIDTSQAALDGLSSHLKSGYPGLEISPICGDYLKQLRGLERQAGRAVMVLFLGSSIGNFTDRGESFLAELYGLLRRGDRVLVGADFEEDASVLLRAYGDEVTAEFNLNLLHRINRELEGTFDPGRFRHRPTHAVDERRMESRLESLVAHNVSVLGRIYHFRKGEAIRTEVSCKYSELELRLMALKAGFQKSQGFFGREGRKFYDLLLVK